MKTTSAHYLLPLLLSVGLPVACSGSTDKIMDPGDSSGAGSPDDGSSGGSKNDGSPGEGGSVATAGKSGTGKGGSGDTSEAGASDGGTAHGGTAQGGTGNGGMAGSAEAGAGPDNGGASMGGDSAGGAGDGGAGGDGGVIGTPVDPTLDGADDAASGRYRLHYKPQPKCLASAQDDGISAVACNDNQEQKFFLDGAGAGFVRVRGVDSNECIGLVKGAAASVVCTEDAKLQLIPTENGYFELVFPNDTCLGAIGDVPSAVTCSTAIVWSLDEIGTNFALKAKWTATSTFPGYSTDYAHDGDHNAGLSGHSWANNWNPPSVVLPQEVNIDLGAKKQFSTVNVFTSAGYEIGSYDLDYWDGAKWVSLAIVKGNVLQTLTHVFPTVVAQKLRFTVRRGPELQFIYTRLNEVEIF